MKTLVTFALPFLLSGLMQMAYSAVDVYFIGKYASAASVSGVSQGVMINAVLTGLFLGITSGGTILLGQCVGAKNHREAAQATGEHNNDFVYSGSCYGGCAPFWRTGDNRSHARTGRGGRRGAELPFSYALWVLFSSWDTTS